MKPGVSAAVVVRRLSLPLPFARVMDPWLRAVSTDSAGTQVSEGNPDLHRPLIEKPDMQPTTSMRLRDFRAAGTGFRSICLDPRDACDQKKCAPMPDDLIYAAESFVAELCRWPLMLRGQTDCGARFFGIA